VFLLFTIFTSTDAATLTGDPQMPPHLTRSPVPLHPLVPDQKVFLLVTVPTPVDATQKMNTGLQWTPWQMVAYGCYRRCLIRVKKWNRWRRHIDASGCETLCRGETGFPVFLLVTVPTPVDATQKMNTGLIRVKKLNRWRRQMDANGCLGLCPGQFGHRVFLLVTVPTPVDATQKMNTGLQWTPWQMVAYGCYRRCLIRVKKLKRWRRHIDANGCETVCPGQFGFPGFLLFTVFISTDAAALVTDDQQPPALERGPNPSSATTYMAAGDQVSVGSLDRLTPTDSPAGDQVVGGSLEGLTPTDSPAGDQVSIGNKDIDLDLQNA
ncbi:hypothetical protein INR49_013225, partial [Caranx melampygus]